MITILEIGSGYWEPQQKCFYHDISSWHAMKSLFTCTGKSKNGNKWRDYSKCILCTSQTYCEFTTAHHWMYKSVAKLHKLRLTTGPSNVFMYLGIFMLLLWMSADLPVMHYCSMVKSKCKSCQSEWSVQVHFRCPRLVFIHRPYPLYQPTKHEIQFLLVELPAVFKWHWKMLHHHHYHHRILDVL